MTTVSVRYIVHDVDAAIEFYCGQLGFHEDMHPAPAFAMLSRGDLRLVLSAPGGGPGGGGQAMPDGTVPAPGGWNRFSLEVPDLAAKTSLQASAASRSWSRIRPAIRSSSSSRRAGRRGWASREARSELRRDAPLTYTGRETRDVAQPGSAPALGAGGRQFESDRPD